VREPNLRTDERATSNDAQCQPPAQLETNSLIALAFFLGCATALGTSSIYRRFFKRIKNAEWVTPNLLKRKRWITGVVTRCVEAVSQITPTDQHRHAFSCSVGDADNFRLYHTPGFGWRGPLKFRHIPTGNRGSHHFTVTASVAAIILTRLKKTLPLPFSMLHSTQRRQCRTKRKDNPHPRIGYGRSGGEPGLFVLVLRRHIS
jgi:hypothetical protein